MRTPETVMRVVSPPPVASRVRVDRLVASAVQDSESECHRLRQAQRISRVGSWCRPAGDPTLIVSEVLLELYGLDAGDSVDLDALQQCVHPDDRPDVADALRRLHETGQPMFTRYRLIRANDGQHRWFDARGVAERDANGAIVQFAGTIADITELVQAERDAVRAHEELSLAHGYQQAVITATPDVIHVFDVASKQLTRANRAPKPLIGFTEEAVLVMTGLNLDTLLTPEDAGRMEDALEQARELPDGEVISLRHQVLAADDEPRWLSRRVTPFERDSAGVVTSMLVVSRDVTDVVVIEQRLEYAALHDEMTGLPNRRLIRDRIAQALRRAARGGHVAVLLCDLDGFKRINDSHGHRTGDALLAQVAARLRDATRSADTVARIGGDEFAIVLDIVEYEDAAVVAEEVAVRITDAIREPFVVGVREHRVSVSIGICLADDQATDETLLADADAAMYFVKTHGANGYVFFAPQLRPDTMARDRIEAHIRRALATDTVEVLYQPIVDPVSHRVLSVEALLRIRDESGGWLDTSEVVDVAEHTGLITALDEQVLRIACERIAEWRQQPEHADLVLNLNRSVTDIARPGFYDRVARALAVSGLTPRALTLEITETVLLDASGGALTDLRALTDLGIGLAIDDFGTGYASLRYLAELPISCIKVDRSFTGRLPDDATSMTLVRATVSLAEQLDISCTIEGVETAGQLDALPDYRRLHIQGYLYARPQDGDQPPPTHISPSSPVVAHVPRHLAAVSAPRQLTSAATTRRSLPA